MGTEKVAPLLNEKFLLTCRVEKFQALGITDILLFGWDCPKLPETRGVPDELSDAGLLGGLCSYEYFDYTGP